MDDAVLRDKILCILISNEGKELTKTEIHRMLSSHGITASRSKINNVLFNQISNLTTHKLEKKVYDNDPKPRWILMSKADNVEQKIAQMIYILLCRICPQSRTVNEIIEYVRSQIMLLEHNEELNTFMDNLDESKFMNAMYTFIQSCLSVNETLNVNRKNEYNITYINRRVVLVIDKVLVPQTRIHELSTFSKNKQWISLFVEYADKQMWGSDRNTSLPSFNTKTSHTFNITRIISLGDHGISFMLGALLTQYETHHIHFYTKNESLTQNVKRVITDMKLGEHITISDSLEFLPSN